MTGEPALEVIAEKDEALHNGDAWGVIMDACIPVIDLIDTQGPFLMVFNK